MSSISSADPGDRVFVPEHESTKAALSEVSLTADMGKKCSLLTIILKCSVCSYVIRSECGRQRMPC